jgi:hypothetical protein
MPARAGGTTATNAALLANTAPPGNGVIASAGTSAEAARADHVHPSQSGVLLPSGWWIPASRPQNTFGSLTLNREYCLGFDLAPQRISRIAFSKTGTPDGSPVLRVGVRADANLRPGAPATQQTIVAAAGSVDLATTDMAYDHPGGILWLSWVGQGWSATAFGLRWAATPVGWCRDWAASAGYLGSGSVPVNTTTGSPQSVAYQDGVSGALPTNFIATGTADVIPNLYFKRA